MTTEPHPIIVPPKKTSSLTAGIILTGIGIIFLLTNAHIIPRISRSWPLILIVVGAALLVGAMRDGRQSQSSGTTPTDPGTPPPSPVVPSERNSTAD